VLEAGWVFGVTYADGVFGWGYRIMAAAPINPGVLRRSRGRCGLSLGPRVPHWVRIGCSLAYSGGFVVYGFFNLLPVQRGVCLYQMRLVQLVLFAKTVLKNGWLWDLFVGTLARKWSDLFILIRSCKLTLVYVWYMA